MSGEYSGWGINSQFRASNSLQSFWLHRVQRCHGESIFCLAISLLLRPQQPNFAVVHSIYLCLLYPSLVATLRIERRLYFGKMTTFSFLGEGLFWCWFGLKKWLEPMTLAHNIQIEYPLLIASNNIIGPIKSTTGRD